MPPLSVLGNRFSHDTSAVPGVETAAVFTDAPSIPVSCRAESIGLTSRSSLAEDFHWVRIYIDGNATNKLLADCNH